MELVRYTFPTWVVPLSNVIFILIVLVAINAIVRHLTPRLALHQGELLVLYVILSLTATLASGNVLQAVLPTLGQGHWFATPDNEYKGLFSEYLPQWLTVSDSQVLQGYYDGESSLYLPQHLKAWIPVTMAWLALYSVFAFNFVCLSTIIRRQWTENERLTYPIIRLPLAMTNPKSNFFRSPRMWIGFGITASISLMNGLSFLYPALPNLDVTRHYFHFNDPPMSFYEGAMLAFYPFAIGIMFLMPLDVLFSTILFYVLYRNQLALGQAMGWHSLPKFPYRGEQAFGALLGLSLRFMGRSPAFHRNPQACYRTGHPSK